MKIYTRTGDKGHTSLFGGRRVSKTSLRVETYGNVDELNSAIGVAVSQMGNSKWEIVAGKDLEKIQHDLFAIGSYLASPGNKNQEVGIRKLGKRVDVFESRIDAMTKELPELRNFILPGGGVAGAQLHMVRTICRRTERRIIALTKKEAVDSSVVMYFNRLSDLLFTMARFVNYKEKKKETIWSQ